MIIETKKLDELIQKYEKTAEKQFQNYQETGLRRYEKAYEDAQDLADTLRMARDAAEDHQKMLNYQSTISIWGSRAQSIKYPENDPEGAEQLIKDVAAMARVYGLLKREE